MDWDDAYDNRGHTPGWEAIPPRWADAAAATRRRLAAEDRLNADIPYGTHPNERLDLMLPASMAEGIVVFIHGGYWRSFGKSDFSHLAEGALARGWAVAMPGYTLCPGIRIAGITKQIAASLTAVARELGGPIRVVGHSAGGHLAARMLCEDAPVAGAVAHRIASLVSISGLCDLRPLMMTAMNDDLQLDRAEAAAESPALLFPRPRVPVTCWVGGDERPEFRRQSALLANIWSGCGTTTRLIEEPGKNHFTVVDGMSDPKSPLMDAILAR